MVEGDKIAACLDISAERLSAGSQIGAQPEGEDANDNGGKSRKIFGKRPRVEFGHLEPHARQPEADIVGTAPDIGNAAVLGESEGERKNIETRGGQVKAFADMGVVNGLDGEGRRIVEKRVEGIAALDQPASRERNAVPAWHDFDALSAGKT